MERLKQSKILESLLLVGSVLYRAAVLSLFIGVILGIAILFLIQIWKYNQPLWESLSLLIIPIALAVGGFLLGQEQQRNERRLNEEQRRLERELAERENEVDRDIAKDRDEERSLQSYFDAMTELLLEKGLRSSGGGSEAGNPESKTIARARTLTVLRGLNGARKGSVVRFLHEAKLIDVVDGTVVDLREADLRGVNLSHTDLRAANLSEVNLGGSDLSEANLRAANLRGADLRGANLHEVSLYGADLSKANLSEANLHRVFLEKANLRETNLRGANLSDLRLYGVNLSDVCLGGVDLRRVNLSGAYLNKTKYNDATRWPESFDPEMAGAINLDKQDKVAPQAEESELGAGTSSQD